jgi:hypothetical protein
MFRKSIFSGALATLLSLGAQAADSLPGLYFSHHDWQIVCDNTRTCRTAGYSNDSAEPRVSVLLTRAAGPGQGVEGQLMLGRYGDEDEAFYATLPKKIPLNLRINGRSIGRVTVPQSSSVADLPPRQIAALLSALGRKASIEWSFGEHTWLLSDEGAAAVLLKMDEFQGCIGTKGAIIRKGPQEEDAVLPPLPAPVVVAAPLAKALPGDAALARNKTLRKVLRSDIEDSCPDQQADSPSAGEISITRLSNSKLLASALCWTAAYNGGSGYWVIDDKPPFHAALVTTSGSDFSGSEISSSQKGRGLGDCWSTESWTWDGNQFVQTEASTTGMCRLMAPGGAWSLPRIVTKPR